MAWVYRPSVTRKADDGSRVSEKSRNWWAKFRNPAGDKDIRIPLHTRDKTTAKQLAAEAERKAALGAAGLGNPYERHWVRSLDEHLDEFERALCDKGVTQKHAKLTTWRARNAFKDMQVTQWTQISHSNVESWLAARRRKGTSAQTSNHYLRAIKQFCRWMVRDRRAGESPIAMLSTVNVRSDRRFIRRALSLDELRWLLAHTTTRPILCHMTGPDRVLLYLLAVETGLRASELKSLTVSNFVLDSNPPTVTVGAGYSKHRKDDTLPLRPQLATRLQKQFMGRGSRAKAFRVPYNYDTADMIESDLEAARLEWLKQFKDPKEREEQEKSIFLRYWHEDTKQVADFHALRHTFITNLARSGIHPKLAQSLARHSTITLTMDRYSHTELAEQAQALAALPDIAATLKAGITCEPAIASEGTGTTAEEGYRASEAAKSVVPNVVPKPCISMHSDAVCCNEIDALRMRADQSEVVDPARDSSNLQLPSIKATRGTRTRDLRFTKPLPSAINRLKKQLMNATRITCHLTCQ